MNHDVGDLVHLQANIADCHLLVIFMLEHHTLSATLRLDISNDHPRSSDNPARYCRVVQPGHLHCVPLPLRRQLDHCPF